MWCVPQLDQEYLRRMEAELAVLNRPLDKSAPVVALDKRPVQLVDSLRPATAMAPGQPARRDYEYARCGTANVFCVVVEPKTGRHQTTPLPTALRPNSRALKRIARRYPAARTIHLVLDNRIGKPRSPPPSVCKRDTGCGRFRVHYSNTVAGLTRPNWKPACGRDNAWGGSGLHRLLSCASAPVPGTGGRIAPNSKSTGGSPPLTRVACFTTNESLPMSQSTSLLPH